MVAMKALKAGEKRVAVMDIHLVDGMVEQMEFCSAFL
jgi:hypothetical protein